jgi:hypothetical protein
MKYPNRKQLGVRLLEKHFLKIQLNWTALGTQTRLRLYSQKRIIHPDAQDARATTACRVRGSECRARGSDCCR